MKTLCVCIVEKLFCLISLLFLSTSPVLLTAQNTETASYDPDTLITAANELIQSTRYCALITLDKSGHPQVRIMDPFYPDENMTVWLGTNVNSRKVQEIRNDSRVTLYYEESKGAGYVVIKGHAVIVDDEEKEKEYWKKGWDAYYSDQKSNYVLIKVTPDELEIIDYNHTIIGDSETWAVPKVKFNVK